ncbi:AAA family ATPase [Brachybacterium huguangmaarense]
MIDVVLCASGGDEVRIVHGLTQDHGDELRVVRRCADLAETLAVAAAGIGDVVLIDLAVRGLSRDALADLVDSGLAVVGLVRPDPSGGTTALGLRRVLDADAPVAEVAAALTAAVAPEGREEDAWVQSEAGEEGPRGTLVAVWGPAGAPGRSTLAANLAHEAALAGCPTILVDADTYGPALAQILGILDESPGLVAAGRASGRGTLDADTLAALVPVVHEGLRFLSGIGVAARWPELRPSSLEGVWEALRATGELVIIDAGFCLEEDEELSYDTMAPRRNAATTTALEAADVVLAVAEAEPVSLTRLLREEARLRELAGGEVHAVLNRLGASVPADRVRDLVASRMACATITTLPDDPATCRRAAWDGALLSEAGPRTALRTGVRDVAARLVGVAAKRHGTAAAAAGEAPHGS